MFGTLAASAAGGHSECSELGSTAADGTVADVEARAGESTTGASVGLDCVRLLCTYSGSTASIGVPEQHTAKLCLPVVYSGEQ